jgi:arylsulfatase A-like enzyme
MRPDFVSEANTPALWKLAREGVTFRNNHAVYLSATNVNGTAIATGAYPDHSGMIANHEFRPKIDNRQPIDVEDPRVVGKGDELSSGKYLGAPTIAELVRDSGKRTAVATAKTVGLLLDRSASRLEGSRLKQSAGSPSSFNSPASSENIVSVEGAARLRRVRRHTDPARGKNSVTIFAGASVPLAAVASIVKMLGPFPPSTAASERDVWTAKALTESLWRDEFPAFSLLWLSEPDDTEHRTAPGSVESLAAIKSSDQILARVLQTLDRRRARETTDVFVVSDHGFSTIERAVDLRKILNDAGFNAVTEFKSEPHTGQIMIVGNGGTVLFYVIEHDLAVTRRLVEFLQQSDFAGVIFTKEPLEGTFTLDQAKIDPPQAEDAPDVVMSFRWNENRNQFGVPGMIDADWQRAAGKGTHATLSRFDMHNTLIAAGPDFRHGEFDDLPTGNVDLAPTILQILGIKPKHPMDGRILSEAMAKIDKHMVTPKTQAIEAAREFSSGTWRQNLKISRVGSTIYLDEGNGAFVPTR